MLALHFPILGLPGKDKTVCNINTFYVWKALGSVAGKMKNASCLKNRTLLVEVFSLR
jgi:hypothetical protein